MLYVITTAYVIFRIAASFKFGVRAPWRWPNVPKHVAVMKDHTVSCVRVNCALCLFHKWMSQHSAEHKYHEVFLVRISARRRAIRMEFLALWVRPSDCGRTLSHVTACSLFSYLTFRHCVVWATETVAKQTENVCINKEIMIYTGDFVVLCSSSRQVPE